MFLLFLSSIWRYFGGDHNKNEPPVAGVQRGGMTDCERIALSGGSASQEFFNFLLLNNSALVRSLDNILLCTLSDQTNPLDRCRGNML